MLMYILTLNNTIIAKKQANNLDITKYYCYLCSVQTLRGRCIRCSQFIGGYFYIVASTRKIDIGVRTPVC